MSGFRFHARGPDVTMPRQSQAVASGQTIASGSVTTSASSHVDYDASHGGTVCLLHILADDSVSSLGSSEDE